jgi:hypothetical protein
MDVAEYIAGQLASCKRKWEEGSFPALIEAFLICTDNGRPLPDWVSGAVLEELTVAHNAGKSATGKRGQAAPRRAYLNNRIAQMRWSLARHWLNNRKSLLRKADGTEYPATREGAFALTAELLQGTIAQGSPDAIEETFDAVEKKMKKEGKVWFDD